MSGKLLAHPQPGGGWIHQGAEQRSPEAGPREEQVCTTQAWPHSDVPKPGSCASGPYTANPDAGLLTSPLPTHSHFRHLHCASLLIHLWPGNGEATLLLAPWGTHWHPLGEAWGRTEMHWGSPSHPSQHLNFPLSLRLHHTWHLRRTYLLFKGFKQTLQATVEVPTDV